jgi:hypothetical protein
MEADIFGPKGAASAPAAPGAAPAAPAPSSPHPAKLTPAARPQPRLAPSSPEAAPAPEPGPDFVIELETAGFASGTLGAGLFLGARLGGDLGHVTVGGSFDFTTSSTSTPAATPTGTGATASTSAFALGIGARYTLASANEGRVDLFGAADAGVVYAGMSMGSTSANASGFTLAAGPGLRLWIFDHLALGYVARLRLTHLAGSNTAPTTTTSGIDGTFQLVGMF